MLQLCYDGCWESLANDHMEYVNAKTTTFLVQKDCTFDNFLARVYEVLPINTNEYSMTMKQALKSSNIIYCACSLPIDIFNDEMVKVVLHIASDVVNYRCISIFVTITPQVPTQDLEPLVKTKTSFRGVTTLDVIASTLHSTPKK